MFAERKWCICDAEKHCQSNNSTLPMTVSFHTRIQSLNEICWSITVASCSRSPAAPACVQRQILWEFLNKYNNKLKEKTLQTLFIKPM